MRRIPFSSIIRLLAITALFAVGMLGGVTGLAAQTRGPHEPPPPVDLGDGSQAVVLRLQFQGREQVSLESAKVVNSRAHGRLGDPPLLRLRLTNAAGGLLEEFNAWHPLWLFQWDGPGGHERLVVQPEATGRFVMPYYPDMAAVEVSDVALGEPVFSGAVADLALSSDGITAPTAMLAGQPINITVKTQVTNNGPAAPMDAQVATAAMAPSGATVTPASATSQVLGLALNETRAVNQTFAIQCNQPGLHTFTFTSDVQPLDADNIDLTPANNQAAASITVDCVVPVAINIKPGSNPNSLNLRGEVGLAVLTTAAGEYGKPLAFNATTINPLSVRFGPEAAVWAGSGGGLEIHQTGHTEDARELHDEKTRDGDMDMALHFDPAQSGLAVGQTEACVKGKWVGSGGTEFTFFGCDAINVVK